VYERPARSARDTFRSVSREELTRGRASGAAWGQFLDRNHDGELELWELREAFRCLDNSLSEEELTQFMAHLSAQNHNRPKAISFATFAAFFEVRAPPSLPLDAPSRRAPVAPPSPNGPARTLTLSDPLLHGVGSHNLSLHSRAPDDATNEIRSATQFPTHRWKASTHGS
jgi:hypothetical protein